MILETKELTKKFGKIVAVNHLDLSIDNGMVFGFLGPNGSGKTTTLGILLGVLPPTKGQYFWFGQTPTAKQRRKIGAILESPCFYPYLSGYRNLKIAAKIKEVPERRIDEVLDIVGLLERKNDSFKTYSLGMKQRLAIASALISNPDVLILDEPTNGLDPQGIADIRRLITEIAQTDKTIILASHLLDEVQKVCSHFLVLQKGKKLYQGSVQEALFEQATIELGAPNMEQLISALNDFTGIDEMSKEQDHLLLSIHNGVSTEELNSYLFNKGIVLSHLVSRKGNLEEKFLKILSEHG